MRDEVLLFESFGIEHRASTSPPPEPDPDLFDGCEVVISGTVESQRSRPRARSSRASTSAQFGDDGRLTMWISTADAAHQDKMVLGLVLGLEPEQVRVVAPDVGGGFGGKGLAVEDVHRRLARARHRQAVRWTETRSENMVAMHHGRAQSDRRSSSAPSRDGVVAGAPAEASLAGRRRLSRASARSSRT